MRNACRWPLVHFALASCTHAHKYTHERRAVNLAIIPQPKLEHGIRCRALNTCSLGRYCHPFIPSLLPSLLLLRPDCDWVWILLDSTMTHVSGRSGLLLYHPCSMPTCQCPNKDARCRKSYLALSLRWSLLPDPHMRHVIHCSRSVQQRIVRAHPFADTGPDCGSSRLSGPILEPISVKIFVEAADQRFVLTLILVKFVVAMADLPGLPLC